MLLSPDCWLNGAQKVIETREIAVAVLFFLPKATAVFLPVADTSLHEQLPISLKPGEARDSAPLDLGQIPSTEWAQVYSKFLQIPKH